MSYFLLIIVCLLLLTLLSGLEIAFFNSNTLQVEIDVHKGNVSAKIISFFLKRFDICVISILLTKTITLVTYGLLIVYAVELILSAWIPSQLLIIIVQIIIAAIILIFTVELLPKVVFQIHAHFILRIFLIPFIIIFIITYPITIVAHILSRFFFKFTRLKKRGEQNIKDRAKHDLRHFFVEKSSETQQKNQQTNNFKIFINALEFSSVKLRECLKPRTELITINIENELDTLIPKFADSGYSKILIYKNSVDTIVGYVHSSDMLKNPESISSILRKIPFVPETMSAKKMLAQFINEKQSIAVVVDEFGGTEGIVTIEDIIEEIFGEIRDEHDQIELEERQINEQEFIFSGRQEIDHLNETYQLSLSDSEEYKTLAGFFLYYHEKFPTINATITINNLKLTVLKITGTRIELIHVKILQDTH